MNIQSSLLKATPIALITLGLAPGLASAEEPAAALYQEHCVACHGSEVYTREDRKVTSYNGLVRQVQRCELSLQLTWFDDQITEVADYLNQHYYHFEP